MSPFRIQGEKTPEPRPPPGPSIWERALSELVALKDWYWQASGRDPVIALVIHPLILACVIALIFGVGLIPYAIIEDHRDPCAKHAKAYETALTVQGTPVIIDRDVCLELKLGRRVEELPR